MAQKRTINLDVNTNAEQVGNQFDNLNKSIDGTTKSNKDLHASFEDVYGEIKPLTAEMGEMEDRLYQMALAGEQATDEFQELLTEVGKYRKVQIETDLAVDQAAGTMSQKLGGALQGAASGFAVVQGAMGLFGTESEEVEEALLMVNSAMAMADGISGLRDASKALNLTGVATKALTFAQAALNAVINLNPFALIVTVVVGLIAYFATFTDAIDVVIDSLKAVTDWLGITDFEAEEAAEKREQEAETQKKLQEAEIKRQETLHNSKMSDLDNEIALARAQGKDTTKLQKKKIEEIIKVKKAKLAELAVDELQIEKQRELLKLLIAKGGKFSSAATEMIKQLDEKSAESEKIKAEIKKLETESKILDIEFEKSKKSKSTSSKKQMISDLEFERKIQDLKLSQLEKTTENEIKILKVKYDRIIEDTKLNESLKEEQKTAIIIEQEKIRDNEINAIRQKSTEKLLTLETKSIEDIKPITELKLQQQKEYYDKVDEIAAKSGKTRKEVEEELKNASFSIAKDTLSLVSELNSLFASENEENAKKAFKIDKATKLASATIAGVQATIEAFKTASASPITIGFPAYPFVQAGLAGSFAAVNIAKIAKSKFQGGGGAGDLDTGGAGGGAGASATPTAQFNVVGDSGINQLAELQNQKPTQAFVVSSEVTTAQSLDRNRVQNATL